MSRFARVLVTITLCAAASSCGSPHLTTAKMIRLCKKASSGSPVVAAEQTTVGMVRAWPPVARDNAMLAGMPAHETAVWCWLPGATPKGQPDYFVFATTTRGVATHAVGVGNVRSPGGSPPNLPR